MATDARDFRVRREPTEFVFPVPPDKKCGSQVGLCCDPLEQRVIQPLSKRHYSSGISGEGARSESIDLEDG